MNQIIYTIFVTVLLAGAGKTAHCQTDTTTHNTPKIMKDTTPTQAFIDKFFVPANSKAEFLERMAYNRGFISKLNGFIKDDVYVQTDDNGNLTVITVAVWQSADAISKAKEAVFAEYERIGFNPVEFYERHKIQLERGIFAPFVE